jgi:hypothetical protein
MEIFTNEFKELLTNQLVELADVVKTKRSNEMSDYEIAKAMEECMGCLEEQPKTKNKKNKKFKQGDIVYLGILMGKVIEQKNDNSTVSLTVKFDNGKMLSFIKDGRYYEEMPILLSHFPYELKMKKIKK